MRSLRTCDTVLVFFSCRKQRKISERCALNTFFSTSADISGYQNSSNPDLEVIKVFSCSTKLSMTFILLINVKTPTIVGVLTFISKRNPASESFKARKNIFKHFSF